MPRLGELLVSARLLDQEQIERALRAQVLWGARLGTNLIELGFLDLDGLSRALGRQHNLPVALTRHFEKGDRELQERLGLDLATKWSVVPLLYVGQHKKIAIAALDPLPLDAMTEIATQLHARPDDLVVSVAAEMRVRYHLERVYGIKRPPRFLRSKGKSVTPFPQFDNVPVPIDSDAEVAVPITIDEKEHPTGRASASQAMPPVLPTDSVDDLAALIDEAIAQATAREPTEPVGRDRRTYVRTLADPPSTPPAATPLGRIAIKKKPLAASETAKDAQTFVDATRAIRRANNRERVAELAMDALQRFVPACEAALLLVMRGDVAIAWKHFSRNGGGQTELAVPLDQPGLVPTVVQRNATARGAAEDLGLIDQALMGALGAGSGDLVVVPLAIADSVMCVIATATESDAPVEGVESVAAAAAAAFARLIRDASR